MLRQVGARLDPTCATPPASPRSIENSTVTVPGRCLRTPWPDNEVNLYVKYGGEREGMYKTQGQVPIKSK